VIVSFFALQRGLLAVVQVSLLGSVLSNTLLVLGCSCLAGGLVQLQPKFNKSIAIANATLLQIAVTGLMVPTLLQCTGQLEIFGETDLTLARGISCVLLVLYILYCIFQLGTHRELFTEEAAAPTDDNDGEEAEEEEVLLSLRGGLAWLGLVTIAIAFISESLTGALEGAAVAWGLSETFVGFVILPIVGNAAEHSTAVIMAFRSKMDLALGVALGSSTQIALFVVPLMVLCGWVLDQPLDLYFGSFETSITFLSTLTVFFIVHDGQTSWLEGTMLLFTYGIICFAFFFFKPEHHNPLRVAA